MLKLRCGGYGYGTFKSERVTCITAQSSTRISKKLKSVPKAIRSIWIKENVENKKKFPVINEIKNGYTSVSKNKKEKPKRSRHQGVYVQHASEDEGVVRGDGCKDVTIASTGLRSTMRTDIPDACTRVMLCIFAMVNLQLHYNLCVI